MTVEMYVCMCKCGHNSASPGEISTKLGTGGEREREKKKVTYEKPPQTPPPPPLKAK